MKDTITRLFAHKSWADNRIVAAFRAGGGPIPEKPLRLFAHTLAAERVWLHRLLHIDTSRMEIWPSLGFDECTALVERNHEGYRRFLEPLDAEDLLEELRYRDSRGNEHRAGRGDILLHVALHGQYHRGQVNQGLKEAGLEPAQVDFVLFQREGL